MNVKPYLLPLYAAATLFPRLLNLPDPLGQVQLTELLFPALLWAFRWEVLATCRQFPLFTWSLTAYVGANLLSALWAGDAGAMLEGGARAYLGVVAILTITHLSHYGQRSLARWWETATVIVAAGALGYYLGVRAGLLSPDSAMPTYAAYPYLGDVMRLRGTGSTSGMWVMLLLPGALFSFDRWKRSDQPVPWSFTIITAAIVVSWSKELLLVAMGATLLWRYRGVGRRLIAGGLAVVLLIGTHYIVVADGPPDPAEVRYRGAATGVRLPGYQLVETVYVPIKRASLRAGAAHPLLGVGPGNFFDYSEETTLVGELPPGFGRIDPHSTWLGAFAETGLLGLLTLSLLVGVIWRLGGGGVLGPVAVALLLFLVASVFKDVANFRGVWVLVGGYVSLCQPESR